MVAKSSASPPWHAVYDELGIVEPTVDKRPLAVYVAEYAEQMPTAVALSYQGHEINYHQLNEEANKLANALLSLNVGHGDVVGLHMPNIPQYAIALVALGKIGAVGSGVSSLLAPTELAHQLTDANIKVLVSLDTLIESHVVKMSHIPTSLQTIVVASENHAEQVQRNDFSLRIDGVDCHRYQELIDQQSSVFAQRAVHWEDTMMLQYTGGTTGPPKGARLSVRCIMSNSVLCNAYEPYEIGKEVFITGFPMFHGAGLAYCVSALRFGATFVLIPDPRDVEFLCQQMYQYRPTRIAGVPSLYQLLLACDTFSKVDFSRLRLAGSGAAPLTAKLRSALEEIIGPNKLSDRFGMTETGPVHVASPPRRAKLGSVGIPVPGADTRIVDLETGTKEMPYGELGEIVTSGPHLMSGYLNLPDETAKALRSWRDKQWMYTGDVGYMDKEGYVFLCDRAKDMLIVGGYKVFSVEVEDKLASLPIVTACALVGTPDTARPGNDIVTLFVSLDQGARGLSADQVKEQIINFCRETMAPYKVPKVVHVVDAIPLTTVGKINKKLLREQALDGLA